MTDVAEVCQDLQAWHTHIRQYLTQPDTQHCTGHAKPSSKPPWNQAVADAYLDTHAAVRELEQNLQYTISGRITLRGGSDGNTHRAIDAISKLAHGLTADEMTGITRQLNRMISACMQLPAIDLEERPQQRQTDCPFCQRQMLRIYPRSGRVACLGCFARGVLVPGTISDGFVAWEEVAA